MIWKRRALLAVLIGIALQSRPSSFAQTLKSGPQVLTFFSDVDDSDQPYAVYLPKNFDAGRKYPLVVSLHGAGSNHRLNLRRVFGKSNQNGENDVEATRYFPEWRDVDFIVASPLARGTMGYQGIAEKDVYDVLADLKKRFPIDEDRVYLTGLSMGGGGTLWLGLTRPDVWAAIAPVCPAPPPETAELVRNAFNLPVRVFQGGADPVVKPEGTRAFVKQLEDAGVKVSYEEYPGVSHDSWVNAYKDEAIFDWFAKRRRISKPERVRFVTSRYKYSSAYWVKIDDLTPGSPATIDVKFAGPNRLEIATERVGGFTLMLAGHPSFNSSQPLKIAVDGKPIEVVPAESISLFKSEGRWVQGRRKVDAQAKRAGAEGPIAEAVAGSHLYVYGTLDHPTEEEARKRRTIAARAADWSFRVNDSNPLANYFSRMRPPSVFFRVVADKEVRPSDLETSNLILFGDRDTNSIIAKHADRLPLHLKADAADYGLIYVFPAGSRYILVNSGLPWWTLPASRSLPAPGASGRGSRPRFRFAGWPAGLLGEFADYRLFKKSFDDIVAEGRFNQAWELVGDESRRLKDSGVVSVKEPSNRVQSEGIDEGVVGVWKLKFDAPDGNRHEPSIEITKTGDRLSGIFQNDEGESRAREIVYEKGCLSFKVDGKHDGQDYTLTFRGKIVGKTIQGETKYEYGGATGSFDFEGERLTAATKP